MPLSKANMPTKTLVAMTALASYAGTDAFQLASGSQTRTVTGLRRFLSTECFSGPMKEIRRNGDAFMKKFTHDEYGRILDHRPDSLDKDQVKFALDGTPYIPWNAGNKDQMAGSHLSTYDPSQLEKYKEKYGLTELPGMMVTDDGGYLPLPKDAKPQIRYPLFHATSLDTLEKSFLYSNGLIVSRKVAMNTLSSNNLQLTSGEAVYREEEGQGAPLDEGLTVSTVGGGSLVDNMAVGKNFNNYFNDFYKLLKYAFMNNQSPVVVVGDAMAHGAHKREQNSELGEVCVDVLRIRHVFTLAVTDDRIEDARQSLHHQAGSVREVVLAGRGQSIGDMDGTQSHGGKLKMVVLSGWHFIQLVFNVLHRLEENPGYQAHFVTSEMLGWLQNLAQISAADIKKQVLPKLARLLRKSAPTDEEVSDLTDEDVSDPTNEEVWNFISGTKFEPLSLRTQLLQARNGLRR